MRNDSIPENKNGNGNGNYQKLRPMKKNQTVMKLAAMVRGRFVRSMCFPPFLSMHRQLENSSARPHPRSSLQSVHRTWTHPTSCLAELRLLVRECLADVPFILHIHSLVSGTNEWVVRERVTHTRRQAQITLENGYTLCSRVFAEPWCLKARFLILL